MSRIALVPGTLRRVCQLTGEHDRTLGRLTPGRTETRVRLAGTDLGSSVELGDRLVFLFGDSWPTPAPNGGDARPALGDTLGWTEATAESADLSLIFPQDADGRYKQFTIASPTGPLPVGLFQVPTGGFAAGNKLHVIYSQGTKYPTGPAMLASVLCRADDPNDLTRLTHLYEVSRLDGGHFINAASVVHRDIFGGPAMVYLWGTGDYRNSHVYLARIPLASFTDPTRPPWKEDWRYWDGSEWVESEGAAAPLFTDHPAQVGELSAAWVGPLSRWLITYQLSDPSGVWFRTAPSPTGPYSEPQLLYHPDWPGVGYGHVLHRQWRDGGVFGTDLLHDRGRGEEGGGIYGPYLVGRFIRADGPDRVRVAFTLSTWNPYQSHLFTASLALTDDPGHRIVPVPFVPTPPPPTTAGGVAMIVSSFGGGNTEVAAPAAAGGMRLRSR